MRFVIFVGLLISLVFSVCSVAQARALLDDGKYAPLPSRVVVSTVPKTPSKVNISTTPRPIINNRQLNSSGESSQAIAASLVSTSQLSCFDKIIERESSWNVHATNTSSGAYGLPQALPGSKMASAGPDWRDNARTQLRWALGYMDSRYGSPCGAISHEYQYGWY